MAETSHAINAVKFRLGRVAKDWGELAAILRQAAAEPDYGGPDLDVIERIENDIAAVKSAVRNWALDFALQHPPTRVLRDRQRAAVLQAISAAGGRR
jgi:hypothetical protein